MGSISHLTAHTTSRNDFNTDFLRPSLLNNRMIVSNVHDFSYEQRVCSSTTQSCYDQLLKIPALVGEFLLHRYADTRMFIRSFSSMFGSTGPNEIDRRINEICQFRTVMQDAEVTGHRAYRRFARLSSETMDLFFYTNSSYLTQFLNETDPHKAGAIRFEILRECDQVIFFQRMLTVVNTFFRVFMGSTASNQSQSGHTEAPGRGSGFGLGGFWEQLFGREETGFSREEGDHGGRVGSERVSGRPAPGVDLNIPNTVPYVQNAIPAAIQEKAGEISRLQARFTSAIPQQYQDPIMREFMEIPVFDASHPAVQSGLAALRAAMARGTGATESLSAHRNARHIFEKDSLEGHIAGGTSWAPAKCPLCRHPEHGGIRRESLRIDTGLQDEILHFLRANVSART